MFHWCTLTTKSIFSKLRECLFGRHFPLPLFSLLKGEKLPNSQLNQFSSQSCPVFILAWQETLIPSPQAKNSDSKYLWMATGMKRVISTRWYMNWMMAPVGNKHSCRLCFYATTRREHPPRSGSSLLVITQKWCKMRRRLLGVPYSLWEVLHICQKHYSIRKLWGSPGLSAENFNFQISNWSLSLINGRTVKDGLCP